MTTPLKSPFAHLAPSMRWAVGTVGNSRWHGRHVVHGGTHESARRWAAAGDTRTNSRL